MSSIEKELPDKVHEYLIKNNISSGSTFIVGLSGGPDSTALLLSLCSLAPLNNYKIIAAYVNHGMRNELQLLEDDHFVKELTEHLDIELYTLKIKPGEIRSICSDQGRSSEEVARVYRYNFFNDIVEKFENPYLLLGHNLDDQLETIITRFFQGSGISGLKGIPDQRTNILRPLIHCRKVEILKFLYDKNQNFRRDPTNDENEYLRNKVRNKLIPLVEEIFPGYLKSMKMQMKRFSEIDNFIEIETELLNCSYGHDSCSVDLETFNSAHNQIRLNLLFKMFDYSYKGNISGFRVPERFFHVVLSQKLEKERVYARAYGIQIHTDKNSLVLSAADNLQSGYFYHLTDTATDINNLFRIQFGNNETVRIEVVRDSPLIVRSYSERDSIQINHKTMKLNELFKTWNIKLSDKKLIPILVDSAGIVAVLGEFLGYKNIFRNKKNNFSEKFNILYLGVGKI